MMYYLFDHYIDFSYRLCQETDEKIDINKVYK